MPKKHPAAERIGGQYPGARAVAMGMNTRDAIIHVALVGATIFCLAGAASAQGFSFGAGSEPRYPANPQYQYPYPYDKAAERKQKRKCRPGEVLDRGKCRPARPLALPF